MYKFDKKKVFPLNGYCTFSEFDESSIMYSLIRMAAKYDTCTMYCKEAIQCRPWMK